MKKIICIVFCLLLMSVATVKAEEAAEDLGNIVITASRMAQYDYKVAGNVTVLDRKYIEASNAQNIPDLLKQGLGVHVVDNSSTKTTTIDIRGFGDTASRNVLVLVNDRILNTVDISSPDLTQIPLSSVERIEIIRGAGSVLYGDRAVGGIVNIITKKGTGPLTGRFGTYFGSYDRRATDVEVSGSKNKLGYYFYSKYNDDHGYRQNSDVLSKDFKTRLDYDWLQKIKVDVDYSYHEDQYGFPGGLSGANLSAMGPRATTTPNNFARSKDSSLKTGFAITPWLQDIYYGQFVLDLYLRDRDVFDSFSGFDTGRGTRTTGITGKYVFDHTIFDKQFNFVTGVDIYDHETDIQGSGSNTDDLTISRTDFGVFGFAEYEALKNLFVNGGGRYYQAKYAFSQRNGVAVDERQKPDVLVYMGGLKYEYAKGSNVHASVQRTFRFLATDEWYSSFSGTLNTDLKQQKGIQYEVGLKHNFADKVTFTVTPYWIDNQDEIYFDPSNFVNTNYDRTIRRGVEIGQETKLSKLMPIPFVDELNFITNYNLQKAQFKGGANDKKDIPLVPHQQFSGGFLTRFLDHYNYSVMGNYVGAQFAINDLGNVSPKIEPYFTLDTKLSYELPNWEVYGAINNIFNQQYSSTVVYSTGSGAQSFYPSPGRNFNVGVNVKF